MTRLVFVVALAFPVILSARIPLGPVHPLTTPGRVVAAGSQSQPQVATSGLETLISWRDETAGRSGVYVAAITDDGALIEGTQRRLSDEVSITPPRLTWTGNSYLVIWTTANFLVETMTIDRERRTLTPEHTILNHDVITSNVARMGGRCAMLAGRNLLLVDVLGNVIRVGIDMNPGNMVVGGHVATDGESFFVFWNAWDDDGVGPVYLRRFTANGDSRDAAPVAVTPMLEGIREDWDVTFGDNRFLIVAAEHQDHADERTLRSFVVNPSTLQSTTLAPLPMGVASGTSVEWVGDQFVALWFHLDDAGLSSLQTLTITTAGTIGSPQSQGCAAGFEAAGIWTGRKLITAFTVREQASYDTDVFAAVADWSGQTREPCSAVALSPVWQTMAAVATNGQQSLIVWTEGTGGGPVRIAAARTTAGVADTPRIDLAKNAHASRPVVLYTGAVYLVLWLEDSVEEIVPYVMMQRVSTSGVVLDPEPRTVAQAWTMAAAWNGTHAIVGWGGLGGAWSARFTRDGLPFDAGATQLSAHLVEAGLAATSNGSDFFFVWEEGHMGEFPSPDRIDLHAARVDATGTRIGEVIPIANGRANQYAPTVASDGRDYVIAYHEDERLLTKRVLREGTLEVEKEVVANGDPITATITALGEGYVLAWESGTGRAEIQMAELDRDGTVKDLETSVATSELGGMWPALATAGGRGDFVHAVLEDDETYGGAMRLMIRRVGPSALRGRAVRH